jgi:transposase
MERRKFTREYKLEAVKLIKDRGVAVSQASHDLGVHQTQLRKWVRDFASEPAEAFPGHGQMKPEQAEIARLKREVTKLKAERDILKKAAAYLRRRTREVLLHREEPSDMADGMDVRGARGLAGRLLCLADTERDGLALIAVSYCFGEIASVRSNPGGRDSKACRRDRSCCLWARRTGYCSLPGRPGRFPLLRIGT